MAPQLDVASVRKMVSDYGVERTIANLTEKGVSKAEISNLIIAVFEGKSSPLVDVLERKDIKVGDKTIGLRVPVDQGDMELPMNELTGVFAQQGYVSIVVKDNAVYGKFATGELDIENPLVKDIKGDYAQVKRAEAEKKLEESQTWRDAQEAAAGRLAAIGAIGIASTVAIAVLAEVFASFGATKAVAETVAIGVVKKEGPKLALRGLFNKAAMTAMIVAGHRILNACSEYNNQEAKATVEQPKPTDYTPLFNLLISLIEKLIDKIDEQNEDVSGLKDALKQIKDILKDIKSANDLTNEKLEEIKGYIPDILLAISNNADLLTSIIDSIGINGKLLEAMLEELTNSNKTLQEIKGMLDAKFKSDEKYQKDDLEYQKTITKILAAIYAAINKLGNKIGSKLQTLVDLMIKQGKSLDEIMKKLDQINKNIEKIEARFDKLFEKFNELGLLINSFKTAVLNAINNIDFSVDVDLSGIEALLNRLANSNDDISAKITKLTTLFNNFSGTTTAQLDTVIKMLGSNDTKLDKLIALLEKMDANNEKRTQKILAAIEKLGVNMIDKFNVIIDQIDKIKKEEGKDYTPYLEAIIDLIQKGNDENNANFLKLFDLIEKLGAKVSYGFNAILDAIKDRPDYTTILNKILEKMESLEGKVTKNGNTLQAILEAIENLNITINVECKCECGCGGDHTTHEGILGDLNELLG